MLKGKHNHIAFTKNSLKPKSDFENKFSTLKLESILDPSAHYGPAGDISSQLDTAVQSLHTHPHADYISFPVDPEVDNTPHMRPPPSRDVSSGWDQGRATPELTQDQTHSNHTHTKPNPSPGELDNPQAWSWRRPKRLPPQIGTETKKRGFRSLTALETRKTKIFTDKNLNDKRIISEPYGHRTPLSPSTNSSIDILRKTTWPTSRWPPSTIRINGKSGNCTASQRLTFRV